MKNLIKLSGVFAAGVVVLLVTSCAPKEEKSFVKVKAFRGNILSVVSTTGTVMPRNRLEIKPPVAGRIDSVLVVEGQKVKKGQVLAWMSSQERAALIDAARAKGEEEVKRWEAIYKPTPIIAPIDGFIIQRKVEPGQSFSTVDTVLVMADQLIVKAQVDETDIGRIKLGQKVEIILDAYPQEKILGEVEHIAYESKVVSNVTIYEVDVTAKNIPAFFRAGMSATVNFLHFEKKDVLLVPIRAVKKRGRATFVFKINPKSNKVEPIQVEAGLENSENIEIISGVEEGEELVVPTKEMVDQLLSRPRGPMILSPFGPQRAR